MDDEERGYVYRFLTTRGRGKSRTSIRPPLAIIDQDACFRRKEANAPGNARSNGQNPSHDEMFLPQLSAFATFT